MVAPLQITAVNANAFLLPLTPSQNQEFDVSLNGVTYHLIFKWNKLSAAWDLDIQDVQRNKILSGIPLVTGCDLLEQYSYLKINGALVVQNSDGSFNVPTFANLGSIGNLYFLVYVAPPVVATKPAGVTNWPLSATSIATAAAGVRGP